MRFVLISHAVLVVTRGASLTLPASLQPAIPA